MWLTAYHGEREDCYDQWESAKQVRAAIGEFWVEGKVVLWVEWEYQELLEGAFLERTTRA